MAAVASIVGSWLGKPVLVKLTGMTEMRGGILDPAPPWLARVRRWSMKRCAAFQATSRRIAAQLVEQGVDPARVLQLPNAVDTERFASVARDPARRESVCGPRTLVGIFVGRLEPEKGLDVLVDAWAQAFAQRRDVALLLVGDGGLRESLAARAARLGVAEQLVFAGPSQDVERYLAIADFGLLTSRFEGLSNALLEYMAAALPVVGSRVSGTEDWVIDGQTGWLVEPGDVTALSQALRAVELSGQPEIRRRGALAQERVRRGASISAVVATLQATYRTLGRQGHG
jgi:glycosyltransferase involved in cell wall biosynthesis